MQCFLHPHLPSIVMVARVPFIKKAGVFITAVPITKMFAWGGGTRDYEPRPVCTSLPMGPVRNPVWVGCVCVYYCRT
jgi:protein-S-isoprenylcysteine O-methyltransferase Ste14